MVEAVDKMSQKVDELHSLLFQARGARWVVLAAVAMMGFLVGNIRYLGSFFDQK
jgi:hypothetical protein